MFLRKRSISRKLAKRKWAFPGIKLKPPCWGNQWKFPGGIVKVVGIPRGYVKIWGKNEKKLMQISGKFQGSRSILTVNSVSTAFQESIKLLKKSTNLIIKVSNLEHFFIFIVIFGGQLQQVFFWGTQPIGDLFERTLQIVHTICITFTTLKLRKKKRKFC